jgi:hypothetical protein
MKKLVKFGVVLCALFFMWNCGTTSPDTSIVTSPIATNVDCAALAAGGTPVWWFLSDRDYLISPTDYSVRDALGNVIGTYDVNTKNIVDLDGMTVLVQGLDLTLVPVLDVNCNLTYPDGSIVAAVSSTPSSSSVAEVITSSAAEPLSSASDPIVTLSSSSNEFVVSSSSSTQILFSSSSSTQIIFSSSSSSYVSSSSAKSSSSSAATSGTCPNLTTVSGGRSGSGFASRYWDCCKPHCAWTANTNNVAQTCDANNQVTSADATSFCDGGSAGPCLSQAPFAVCDNVAYAFAAVPAGLGGECGKCFMLTFTGTGKYETKTNHKKLAGKKLVVMVSNIGGDVGTGQFDIMIPGGGVGQFNGCSAQMGISSFGEQYGGLLSSCETEVGYSGEVYQKRKDCLINKCNNTFGSSSKLADALAGCLFLANWMEAAGNPNHTYQEVQCPQELTNRY